jgi:benzodiazapine receptor
MDTRALVSSVGLPLAAAALGSVASATGVKSPWYRALDKPVIQPPAAVFPIVWTALYTQTAIASEVAQSQMSPAQARGYRRRLAVNMALNAGWCWTFFRGHRLAPSIAVAGALTVSSVDLALTAGTVSAGAGRALAPYATWSGFATLLTAAIWRRNR